MKGHKLLTSLGALVAVTCTTGLAFAADGGFGDLGNNIADQSVGMANGIMNVGLVVGLILVVAGLVTFATKDKTNVQAKVPITMCVVGFLLFSITAFISAGSTTLWGEDQSTASQSALELDSGA